MASAPSNTENRDLHKRIEALEAEVPVLEEKVTALRRTLSLLKKIQEMKDSIAVLESAIRDMPESDIGRPPAALPGTGAAAGVPAVGLHRTYANLSSTGHWEYYVGGKWDPQWIEDNE